MHFNCCTRQPTTVEGVSPPLFAPWQSATTNILFHFGAIAAATISADVYAPLVYAQVGAPVASKTSQKVVTATVGSMFVLLFDICLKVGTHIAKHRTGRLFGRQVVIGSGEGIYRWPIRREFLCETHLIFHIKSTLKCSGISDVPNV